MSDYCLEPVHKDWRLLLLLTVLSLFGLLLWMGLFYAVKWALVAAWGVAVTSWLRIV